MVDNSSSFEYSTLQQLNEYDDEQLLEELGQLLLGPGIGFGPGDLARYRRVAFEWLNDRSEALRQSICSNPGVCAIIDDVSGSKIADAAVIADAISALLGKPSASIVAVILLRRGLATFCAGGPPILPGV